VLREIAVAAVAALAYFGIRNLTVGAVDEAFANADWIIRLEERLRLDWEHALQRPFVDEQVFVTLFNWIYIWGHWPVIVLTAITLYRLRHDRYVLLRNAIFLSGAIGFLFFALFPVAPPRLVDPALVDTVTQHSDAYRALQPPGLTNQYAAFPSLHFGWNLLVGIALWGTTTRVLVRAFAVAGPLAMAAAVIVTANHYLFDVLGGLVVVLAALSLIHGLNPSSSR
jgi:membrane-associated phospholipid phosphatase